MPPGDLWVFGYGSLMWHPDFPHAESQVARLHGYHRALCLWSWSYRGTPEAPGLVLGLDRGGSCRGLAFRVASAERERVLSYLHEREMVNSSYRARMVPVRLADGCRVSALTFIVRREIAQYAGKLALERMVDVIRHARGSRGPNDEYVLNTVCHLQEMGFPCRRLHAVARCLRAPG